MRLILMVIAIFVNSASWANEPSEIYVPDQLRQKLKSFEPSGSLYLSDFNLFMVAIDDTTKKDEPLLFLMDDTGKVDGQPIQVKGLEKMTDIESMSQDNNGTLFLLSSQSLDKSGKSKYERNLFVRASRSGREVTAQSVVELRPLLLDALKKSTAPVLRKMRNRFENELDIEAHFVRNGDLYLGLKNPQPARGQAIIANVGSVDKIFSESNLKTNIWKTINFSSISGDEDLLSEILTLDDYLLLTTTTENGTGRLWRYIESTDQLSLIEEFVGFRCEGLAHRAKFSDVLIVFDQGSDIGRFALRGIK